MKIKKKVVKIEIEIKRSNNEEQEEKKLTRGHKVLEGDQHSHLNHEHHK